MDLSAKSYDKSGIHWIWTILIVGGFAIGNSSASATVMSQSQSGSGDIADSIGTCLSGMTSLMPSWSLPFDGTLKKTAGLIENSSVKQDAEPESKSQNPKLADKKLIQKSNNLSMPTAVTLTPMLSTAESFKHTADDAGTITDTENSSDGEQPTVRSKRDYQVLNLTPLRKDNI